jgi:hypothetical protein
MSDVSEAESYYAIVALSARQAMGDCVLTVNTSDGEDNTVDVMYPAMPFFLYANPELLRFNLNPLFQSLEGGFYPNG